MGCTRCYKGHHNENWGNKQFVRIVIKPATTTAVRGKLVSGMRINSEEITDCIVVFGATETVNDDAAWIFGYFIVVEVGQSVLAPGEQTIQFFRLWLWLSRWRHLTVP